MFAAYDGQSALELVVQLEDIALLTTNTRLGVVDGPELMRRTREKRPGPADPARDSWERRGWRDPPGVVTLREPFTPNQLLLVVGTLLA